MGFMRMAARRLTNMIFSTNLILYFLLAIVNTSANSSVQINGDDLFDNHNKGPTPISGDHILFVSTLDGQLSAVDFRNGKMLWSIQEAPILKMSKTEERGMLFLASPIDGSLYTFRLGNEGFKKLPLTIPDLVSASPSRGEDGALYTGHKKDSWISVDLLTGNKHQLLDSDGIHEICPSSTPSTIFIGRTEYLVNLYDKNSGKIIWNATFTHYTSHLSLDTSTFGMKHFASSSDGFLVTMDAETGSITWTQQFDSPIVGIYSISSDGAFISRPFHSMGLETLEHLSEEGLVGSDWADKFSLAERFKDSFLPTLYVGRHGMSSYALLSFVDASLVSVLPKNFGRPLLEASNEAMLRESCEAQVHSDNSKKPKEFFIIGHHEVPDIPDVLTTNRGHVKMLEDKSHSKQDFQNATLQDKTLPSGSLSVPPYEMILRVMYFIIPPTIIVLLGILILQNKNIKHQLRGKQDMLLHQLIVEDLEDETFKIGKITYHKKDILGKGCQGTIVFKGRFEDREVAVKRVLTEFVDVAKREIDLLQMSDYHHNVIRYFSTERDHQFFYIALEFCPLSLHDVVMSENKSLDDSAQKDIIRQMLAGISHLHSLNIVHRDIKPQNVLLSGRNENGNTHVKISDFGLCRRIAPDNSYFSKSGTVGTIGWMAPEVIDKHCLKASKAVDIFSTGLVIFYVLSGGRHPFGESEMRQFNIIKGKYFMQPLVRYLDNFTAQDIIKRMIANDPNDRPPIEKVQKHPAFWSNEKSLKFIEVVSDRLEKLSDTEHLVAILNKPNEVIRKDWTKTINPEFLLGNSDMKKFRSYKGTSVKDLVRFIRNKSHHYRELTPKIQEEVGSLPDGFMSYFVERFPALILHTYKAMKCLKDETLFEAFY